LWHAAGSATTVVDGGRSDRGHRLEHLRDRGSGDGAQMLGGVGAWPVLVAGCVLLTIALGGLWRTQKRRD